MELGVHLPQMRFDGEPLSLERLRATVDAARDFGFVAVSANDHFVFQTPWLDGPTALASMIERSGVCVGPADHCAELLSRYAEAGCERVYLWPLGDEPRQLELIAGAVAPQLGHS